MTYELWDTESRNIVGDYAAEADALAVVRDVVRLDGRRAIDTLLLAFEDARGKTTVIAAGDELAKRAEEAAPEAPDRTTVASALSSSVIR